MPSNPPLAAWGLSGDLRPLPGGHSNTVLLVEGDAGQFVLKTTRRGDPALRWLIPLWDAAEQAGFLVARLIPTASGDLTANGWTCEPFVSGCGIERDDLIQLRPMIEAFHQGLTDLPQRPGFVGLKDLTAITHADNIDLRGLSRNQRAALRACLTPGPTGQTGAIHGDVHVGNVLHTPSGQPVLLDWDEARCDFRFFDLLNTGLPKSEDHSRWHAAWEIAACSQTEPDYVQQLVSQWFHP